GVGTVVVRASQAGNGNYNAAATVDQSFTVAKADQTISFGALTNKAYGDASFTISATATSQLPVSFSILSGPATISGNTVSITGAGTVVVRASQAGTANYNAANNVDQSFVVKKAVLAVTADNKTRVFGTANPPLSASYSGFVNGDSAATSITGAPAVSSSATLSSAAGSYLITVTQGTLAAINYSFNFLNGALTIQPA